MKYWLLYLKIVAGATGAANWMQNQSFLLPLVQVLIVMWEMMGKSVANIPDIDDDPMCWWSSRPGFCSYDTKTRFSYHKHTHPSCPRVSPSIQSSTSNIQRSLQWHNSWNNYSCDCEDCCPLIARIKDDCLQTDLRCNVAWCHNSTTRDIIFLSFHVLIHITNSAHWSRIYSWFSVSGGQ